MTLRTGRVRLGSKNSIKEMQMGRAKLTILSSNCPAKIKQIIEEYGRLSDVPLLIHQKNSIDLGVLCGKPFAVSTIAINEPGDSKILDMVKK
jgi:large subunit ribosomal protein L30e